MNANSHSQIHSVPETLSEHALRNERAHSFHHLDCSLLCRSRRNSNVFFFSNAQIQQHANLFVIWFQQGIQWTLKLRID
jgi:hypothetical protein